MFFIFIYYRHKVIHFIIIIYIYISLAGECYTTIGPLVRCYNFFKLLRVLIMMPLSNKIFRILLVSARMTYFLFIMSLQNFKIFSNLEGFFKKKKIQTFGLMRSYTCTCRKGGLSWWIAWILFVCNHWNRLYFQVKQRKENWA